MTIIKTIRIEDDVYFNDEFQEILRKRLLSKVVNQLLRTNFNVKSSSLPANQTLLDDELRTLAIRKALVMEKKEELEKEQAEEEAKKEEEKQQILNRIPKGDDFYSKLTREKMLKENPKLKDEV